MRSAHPTKVARLYIVKRQILPSLAILCIVFWAYIVPFLHSSDTLKTILPRAKNGAEKHLPLANCSCPILASSANYQIVKKVASFFEERKVDYIIFAGTFLQLYRDCNISKDSSDVDFAIPLDRLTTSFKDEMIKDLGFRVSQTFGMEGEMGHEWSLKTPAKTKVDVFSLNCNSDGFCWTPLWIEHALFRCGLYPVYPTASLTVGEDQFSIPRYPATFLEQLYGSNWTTPVSQRSWDWKSPFCRAPVAV